MGKSGKQNRRVRAGKSRRQAGQNLLELALVTPLLVAMVLGAIELGRYAYLSIMVGDAAHAGALYGAQSNIDAADAVGICQAAENDYESGEVPAACYNTGTGTTVSTPGTLTSVPCPSGSGCSSSNLTVSSTDGCGCDVGGTYTQEGQTTAGCGTQYIDPTTVCTSQSEWVVTVSVKASATFHSLFDYPWIPNTLTITKTATMRVEQD